MHLIGLLLHATKHAGLDYVEIGPDGVVIVGVVIVSVCY